MAVEDVAVCVCMTTWTIVQERYRGATISDTKTYALVRIQGSTLSVLAIANFGSSISMRNFVRIGSALSCCRRAVWSSDLSVLEQTHLGSSLSVREFCRFGSKASVLDYLVLEYHTGPG